MYTYVVIQFIAFGLLLTNDQMRESALDCGADFGIVSLDCLWLNLSQI